MAHPMVHPLPSRAVRGFTVIEMVVTLAIFMIVVMGILTMFDVNGRIARVEGRVTDMQQSLRAGQQDMVRIIRMAARGGLPAALFPDTRTGFPGKQLPAGLPIEVANNVAAGTTIAGSSEAQVLQGTDVITVRGVFSTLYQTNPLGAGFSLTDANGDGVPEKGSLTLANTSPTGVPQDLQPIAAAIDATQGGQPEAYLLVSPLDNAIFAVVEIDPASSYVKTGGVVTQATIRFNASGTARSDLFTKLSPSGAFPSTLSTVAYSGVLEEYRYYVRDTGPLQGKIQAGKGTQLDPCLVRARLYPGTGIPYENKPANLHEEIADDVFDLQATLGLDLNGDQIVSEGSDAAGRKTDEWLFNEAGDDTTLATWNGTAAAPRRLSYLRLTTLARTSGADSNTQWQAPSLARVEDKDYQASPFNELNSATQRRYRRQSMQSLVDLRNLS
ncbi:MAG TPA: prepilin-type N-terminal cleavage/methylation domain-containing protein [Thermoanaerobaculia bacterium]|nr:prepilin-type N-terminal cleavage/methylation domain-containing protein [Thermoanaerobaculia bacterium]